MLPLLSCGIVPRCCCGLSQCTNLGENKLLLLLIAVAIGCSPLFCTTRRLWQRALYVLEQILFSQPNWHIPFREASYDEEIGDNEEDAHPPQGSGAPRQMDMVTALEAF